MCGINDDEDAQIQDTTFTQNKAITTPSVFLKSFLLDSMSIATDQRITNLKYQPHVNAFANTGMNAVYQPSFNRFGLSTGINFNMTLYDGKQKKLERQKSEINLQNLDFEKQKSREQNTIQKNYSQNQINSLNHRLKLVDGQLGQYNKLLEMYKVKLANAEISIMDFKYLLKDISTKKQERLLLEMEKQIVINAYNYWNY